MNTNERKLPKIGYSVDEAAQVTSLCRTKLYDLMKRGTLRYTLIGSRRIIPHDALQELINGKAA